MIEYPIEITKDRGNKEALVLGGIFNDMLLVKEYKITSDMFRTDNGKFYFGIIKTLIDKEIYKVTDMDIRVVLPEELVGIYTKKGGFKTIEKLKHASEKDNFEAHLDNLLKSNLLIAFIDDNINLSEPIELKMKSGKVITKTYLDIFENMNTEQIMAFMQTRITDKVILPKNNGIKEEESTIPKSFIDDLMQGSELGVPFDNVKFGDTEIKFLPTINKEILGLRKGGVTGIAGLVNQGKSTVMTIMGMSLAGEGEKILYISNEMRIRDFRINYLCYVLANVLGQKQITKKKLKSGNLTPEEIEYVETARLIYNENLGKNIFLVSVTNTDYAQVEFLTRKYALSKGITVLMYDTFKAEYSTGEEDYKDLIKASRVIDELCKRYDLVGVIAIQVSQTYANELIMSIDMLAGAKQINEVLDSLIMFRNVFPQELDREHKFFCTPYTWVKSKVDGKMIKKDIDIDKEGIYRMAFIVKTRDGAVYNDNQTAYLWNFNGKNASVKEICRAEPKRGMINQRYGR